MSKLFIEGYTDQIEKRRSSYVIDFSASLRKIEKTLDEKFKIFSVTFWDGSKDEEDLAYLHIHTCLKGNNEDKEVNDFLLSINKSTYDNSDKYRELSFNIFLASVRRLLKSLEIRYYNYEDIKINDKVIDSLINELYDYFTIQIDKKGESIL